MRRRRRPTVVEVVELFGRIHEANRPRAVGDRVLSYDLGSETTIAKIEGSIATLANGDKMHVSKVRSAK